MSHACCGTSRTGARFRCCVCSTCQYQMLLLRCSYHYLPPPPLCSIFNPYGAANPDRNENAMKLLIRWRYRRPSPNRSSTVSTTPYSKRQGQRRRHQRLLVAMMFRLSTEFRSPAPAQESPRSSSRAWRRVAVWNRCPWAGSTRSPWCIRGL